MAYQKVFYGEKEEGFELINLTVDNVVFNSLRHLCINLENETQGIDIVLDKETTIKLVKDLEAIIKILS